MAIIIHNVRKEFKKFGNSVMALNDINMKIESGEIVAIVGVSGSGKSTLLNLIGLIDKPTSGTITIDDVNVVDLNEKERAKLRNRKIGFVLQEFGLIEEDSVEDNITLPLKLANISSGSRKERAEQLIKALNIEGFSKKKVNTLSGGQKQRVAIARSIAMDPEIILADEPTGALDNVTKIEVMDIFRRLHDLGKTIIIVTHDMEIANQCSRIVCISDGKIIENEN